MDKQEQILLAALKLFVEFGFHGTPTSKIAQEAGVSNGTLFHYYKTKDELVVALYVYIKTNLSECFNISQADGETVRATFKRLYLGWMYWALENPVEFKFTQQFNSSPYQSMLSNEAIQNQTQRLISLMQEAINTRVLKPLPVELMFTLISSHLYGINEYLLASNPAAEKKDEIINQSFDILWDMIT